MDVDNHNGYAELLTKVLTAGSVHLLKQGLHRDYQAVTKSRCVPSAASWNSPRPLRQDAARAGIAVCTHDEFTADIPANQILKSVLIRMARTSGMNPSSPRRPLAGAADDGRDLIELTCACWVAFAFTATTASTGFCSDLPPHPRSHVGQGVRRHLADESAVLRLRRSAAAGAFRGVCPQLLGHPV